MITFEYVEPRSLDEALDMLGRYGDDAKLIAGGTALVNLMKQRLVQPAYLIGLRQIGGLDGISGDGELRIGALCTHRQIETSAVVQSRAPLLTETFHHVATVRIRNIATFGGLLAHADPNLDPPPTLICLDARVRVRSRRGERDVPIDQFFSGYYETVLEPDEVVAEVIIPSQPANSGTAFLKFLPRTQDDYATVSAAVRLTVQGNRIADARVALGSAGPTPIRARVVEDALRGQALSPNLFREAAALVTNIVDPISDFRGSAEYKRDMSAVFVRRALEQAVASGRGG